MQGDHPLNSDAPEEEAQGDHPLAILRLPLHLPEGWESDMAQFVLSQARQRLLLPDRIIRERFEAEREAQLREEAKERTDTGSP